MTKRKLTQNQHRQIEKNLTEKSENNNPSYQIGLIQAAFKKQVILLDKHHYPYQCAIPAKIPIILAGDKVKFTPIDDTQGMIHALIPRDNLLERTNYRQEKKALAANITQLIVVIAPLPEPSFTLLDSYLIMAKKLSLTLTIILNKSDLPHHAILTYLKDAYEPLGYPIIVTSQADINSAILPIMAHHTTIVVGQSGVGKSSIIQSLLPNETNIATNALSDRILQGKHTTTHAKVFILPNDGYLIDSPGVRGFGLWHIDKMAIIDGYPEFIPYFKHCQFRNCTHIETKGCGLLKGILDKKIHPSRYAQFIKVCEQYSQSPSK
jgi:ribosome biogenesis GTPase